MIVMLQSGHDWNANSANFPFPRTITQKLCNPDLQFLHSVSCLILVNKGP